MDDLGPISLFREFDPISLSFSPLQNLEFMNHLIAARAPKTVKADPVELHFSFTQAFVNIIAAGSQKSPIRWYMYATVLYSLYHI